VALAKAF